MKTLDEALRLLSVEESPVEEVLSRIKRYESIATEEYSNPLVGGLVLFYKKAADGDFDKLVNFCFCLFHVGVMTGIEMERQDLL